MIHLLGDADALSRLGRRVVVLGANARWTSFVPLDIEPLDDGEASRALDAVLVHVWFDDDAGVVLHVHASGTLIGELALPLEDADVGASDLELLEELDAIDVISKKQRATLLGRLAEPEGLRAWVLGHGVERELDFPVLESLPVGAPETILRGLLPSSAAVVEPAPRAPRAGRAARRPTAPSSPPPSRAARGRIKPTWSDEERRVIDHHVLYWQDVFSMNNFRLYNRYKKHLPVNERGDVDRLCDAVALGDTPALRARVESILARVWDRDDWAEVIRDPELEDGDEEVWTAFRARIGAPLG